MLARAAAGQKGRAGAAPDEARRGPKAISRAAWGTPAVTGVEGVLEVQLQVRVHHLGDLALGRGRLHLRGGGGRGPGGVPGSIRRGPTRPTFERRPCALSTLTECPPPQFRRPTASARRPEPLRLSLPLGQIPIMTVV